MEDVRRCGEYDVAVLGAPHDSGTTYRPGTRFGPQGMRRISGLYGPYSFELGVDLRESVTIGDLGDVFTIPGNIEKTFDQISKAVSHVYASGAFPVVLGGDHSIGYPTVRGVAEHLSGNLGIIHFDRHVDTQEVSADVAAQVPKELIDASYTLGARRWAVVRKVVIPHSVPGLLDAMRVNIVAATWNLVVVAELIASQEGLGYRITRAQRFLQTDQIFAVLIVIGIIGVSLDLGFRLLRNTVAPWAR